MRSEGSARRVQVFELEAPYRRWMAWCPLCDWQLFAPRREWRAALDAAIFHAYWSPCHAALRGE